MVNYYNTNTETYWETMEGAPVRPLSSYPEGTIIVSKRPSPHAEYVAGAWVEDADTSDQQLKEDRRGERAEEFSQTFDILNPICPSVNLFTGEIVGKLIDMFVKNLFGSLTNEKIIVPQDNKK